jgi:hypothetical protein
MKNINKEIENFIIRQKVAALTDLINFYKTAFLPGMYDYSGITQPQALIRAEENKKAFLLDIKDYSKTGRFDLLEISESEILNYIRLYAVEQREKAQDFNLNPYIKIPSLKNCIIACKKLIELKPELNIYSLHWLSSRNIIKL